MHFPFTIPFFGIEVPVHPVCDVAAVLAAFWCYSHLRAKTADFISEKNRWTILTGASIGGLFGSRILAFMENPAAFWHQPVFYYFEEKTVVGFLVGAILGVEIAKKCIGEKRSSGDLFTYPLMLGMVIGRIGCFLTGVSDETVGLPSGLPWAFPQGDGIPRHPTSLYEIVFLLFLWLFFRQAENKFALPEGIRFRLFAVTYCLFRFFVEYVKPAHAVWAGLSAIQIVCTAVVVYYAGEWMFYFLKKTLKYKNFYAPTSR